MQDRLMRSRHDRMIAGVCGGLGAYFDIDPTLVRLVVVLLGIVTWGGAILPYIILCLVMPKQPPQVHPFIPPPSELPNDWSNQPQNIRMVPPGSWQDQPIRFDPYTGQPVQPVHGPRAVDASRPATSTTIQLERDQIPDARQPVARITAQLGPDEVSTPEPTIASAKPFAAPGPARASRWQRRPTLGIILVGIGVLAMADQLQIAAFLFPLALIAIGAFLLFRRG